MAKRRNALWGARPNYFVYEVRAPSGGVLARADSKTEAKRYQRETGGRIVKVLSRNPSKRNAGDKSVTLRNMASVTIRRLPGGAVAVTGRKMVRT